MDPESTQPEPHEEHPESEEYREEYEPATGINSRRNSLLLILGVGVIFALIVLFQMFVGGDDYILKVQKDRKKKDSWFKNEPDSPLPDSLKASFPGLNYYEVDRSWKVTATLIPNPKFETYAMPQTGAQDAEVYVVIGKLEFKIKGKKHVLIAFQPNEKDSKTLFVPFRDATSGKTTYGGGRYIDTRRIDNKVVLDFNLAYNPYCLWDYTYVCPIPPEANTLSIAVEAGEKDYKMEY